MCSNLKEMFSMTRRREDSLRGFQRLLLPAPRFPTKAFHGPSNGLPKTITQGQPLQRQKGILETAKVLAVVQYKNMLLTCLLLLGNPYRIPTRNLPRAKKKVCLTGKHELWVCAQSYIHASSGAPILNAMLLVVCPAIWDRKTYLIHVFNHCFFLLFVAFLSRNVSERDNY